MKLNISNGGPAPEIITNKIFKASQLLTSYKVCKIQLPDFSEYGTYSYGETTLEIIDGLRDYSNLMEKIFDFDQISFFLMIRRPPRSTPLYSSAASDVYKRQLRSWATIRDIQFHSKVAINTTRICLLYTSPSPRDRTRSRMPSSA